MKPKPLKQTERTKNFVLVAKNLKKTGVVKSYNEIISALEWDKTSFSNVINGRQNIPDWRYTKFVKVYGIEIENPDQIIVENSLRIEIMCTVLLSTMGEILAHQRGQPVAKVVKDLEGLVSELLIARTGKL